MRRRTTKSVAMPKARIPRTRRPRRLTVYGPMNRARLFLKSIAALVTVAFLGLTLQPLALAANAPSQSKAQPRQETNEEKLSKTLEGIEKKLDSLEKKLAKKEDASKEKSELKVLKQDLDTLDAQALKDFDKIEQHIKDKNLPAVILNRHLEAVKQYKQEMATLKANLTDAEQETDDAKRELKLKKTKDHLKAKQKKKGPKTKFDPNDMPHKALEPNPNNKPKLKKEEFVRAGLHDNPYVKVASHGGTFTFDRLAGASDPAYLAETVEVKLTDAIKAKAAELEHHPVKIYNWVRNNVEWLPTWGASQDSDITLGSQRGNAFDISSLLIALYRASGIPARYVHGTIDVPEDKFRNWAGGFTDIKAAGDYAASGGIPVTGVTTGGKITKIRMEHIWVEAALDLHPSRGAINKSADSWVSLDPTYKQYNERPGIDVIAVSGIDLDVLSQSYSNSGNVNDQEGWVSQLDPLILQNAQSQFVSSLQAYLSSNIPNASVADITGSRTIEVRQSTVLPTNLSNRVVIVGSRYGSVPNALANTMTLGFGVDLLGDPIGGVTYRLAQLNNHKVTLAFKPATAADEATLTSLLNSGSTSIPSYLVSVIPEIAVDGNVVALGSAMRLGEDLNLYYGIGTVGGNGTHAYVYPVPAGAYLALAIVGGSVSPQTMEQLSNRLDAVGAILSSGSPEEFASLSRDDYAGNLFYAGVLAYFAEYIALAYRGARSQNAEHGLPIGYGSIGFEPDVDVFFGFPRAIRAGGSAVNIRLEWVVQGHDGAASARRTVGLQSGLLSSALEHEVPEQFYNDPDNQLSGISAVKALALASAQGQRTYHITQANQGQALPNLRLDAFAVSEISDGLQAGREVLTHTDRISVTGWAGEGYIIFEPTTGAGAYKITGGRNGAFLYNWSVGIAEAFLLVLNQKDRYVKSVTNAVKHVSGAGKLVGLFLDIYSVANECNDPASIAIAGAVLFGFTALFAVAVPTGVFAALFLQFALIFVQQFLEYVLFNILLSGCRRP